jgi:hypothetical protein
LFGIGKTASGAGVHAVIVHFRYGSTDLERLFEVETRLEEAIAAARAGEFDGNEVAVDGSDGRLFMYGPDADRLYDVVRPILESVDFMRGATVELRYGPADGDAPEATRIIGE